MRPLPTPEQALEEVRSKNGKTQNLRALGRVTYFGDKGRVRLKAVFLAERPGAFRVETISPFEQPIDVMACDGEQLWLLSENRLRHGPATPENISRLLPLAMHPAEVVDALLGGVPSSSSFAPTAIEAKDDLWILTMEGRGEQATLRIDPTRHVVTELSLGERLSVSFGDFEPIGDRAAFPRKIEIEMKERALEVSIRLKETEVDVPLARELFAITPPNGVTAEPL